MVNGRNIVHQLWRGALVGLLLTPTVIGCLMAGSLLLGYRFSSNHGTSMEPTLSDGDMIWEKRVPVATVRVGDIVSLSSDEHLWIAHRVIRLEHLPHGGYLLETKGDANWLTEVWEISADETVPVVVARMPLAGYLMDSLASAPVRVLLISLAVVVVVMWIRRRRECYNKLPNYMNL